MRGALHGKRCMIWSFMGNSRMFQALNTYGDRFDTVGLFTFEVDITGSLTETGTSMTYKQIIDRLSSSGAKRMRSDRSFSISAVQAILSNELYVGDRNLRKSPSQNYLTKRPDPNAVHTSSYHQHDHEPIIDRDIWERAQAILAQRKKETSHGIHRKGKETHFLYGKVFCANCGAPYTRRTFKEEAGTYKVWYCRERQKGKSVNRCKNAGIREDVLLQAISGQLGCSQVYWQQVDAATFQRQVDRIEVHAKNVVMHRVGE